MNDPYRPVSVTVGIVSIVIGGIIVAMSIGFSSISAGGILDISLTGLALYPTSSLTPPPRALVPLGVVGLIAMLSGTSLNGLQNHDG
jgi:hypothetical protein